MCTEDMRQYHQTSLKVNYLGSLLTKIANVMKKIKKRIGKAKDAFQKLKKIVKNSKLSLDIRNVYLIAR